MNLHRSLLLKASCLLGAAVLSFTALAQTDRQLAACYAIADDNARLACYDTLARPARAEPEELSRNENPAPAEPPPVETPAAPAPVVEAAVPARAEPAVTTVESFGDQPARIETDAEGETTLVGTIAAIDEVEPNKLQITLSNGQVWKQSVGKRFLLRENDRVRIRKTRWGSAFRLEKDGKPGYIQVLRLR